VNSIKGVYVFEKCKFENILDELINYEWQSNDIMGYKLKFSYDNLKLL